MAQKPIEMLQIRRIIQLHQDRTSLRAIALQCGLARKTVRNYIEIISQSGLAPVDLLSLEDEKLSAIIFDSPIPEKTDKRLKVLLDLMPALKKELPRTGVTKQLLWQEYKVHNPDGYGYSQFCYRVMQYLQSQDLTMHFEYAPGDKLMIDFVGKKFNATDSHGQVHSYQVFIATFPFSGYTYSEAIQSQRQEDFLRVNENALIFFEGVPKCIIPDNLKSGVTHADRYEPKLTELMDQFCLHYNTSMMPARVRKPKDKPHVENAVHLAYQRIYAPLRNRTFDSLEELNEAILVQLDAHHARPFRNSPQTRKDLFESQEKPLLKELPSSRLEIVQMVEAKVQKNYHVVLGQDWHYYSVPFDYVGKQTVIQYTQSTVEIYCEHNRIAVHPRVKRKNGYSTLKDHMPERHLRYHQQKGWDAEFFCNWAKNISPKVEQAIRRVLENNLFYEQNYNACLGILRLADKYSAARLITACDMALRAKAVTYRFISNVLKNNTDKRFAENANLETRLILPDHENLRGPEAYQ